MATLHSLRAERSQKNIGNDKLHVRRGGTLRKVIKCARRAPNILRILEICYTCSPRAGAPVSYNAVFGTMRITNKSTNIDTWLLLMLYTG